MGVKYLWDTNPAIYYLQKQFPAASEVIMDNIITEATPAISAITEIELLCWKAATENDINVLKSFIKDSVVFGLEELIKEKTVEIRKTYSIKLPDAIIAATALAYDLTLITRNTKDFAKIPQLKLIDPYQV
ncbi:type II toxin-antitoxin system VapC family toxin [Mucilaginibacter mali]|uniref:Type II toxin-antitoxin system VapC family toxin n=1 Tax=Mucilaginibacter mali TaxID=2740462 RepID=A0A7D4QVW4_9SPHI|nr:type II toxin-antitoxin system VapC family toxin [Mucilaginibacter mali]QKJ31949.1 type II toxin-antitoxin system VapC family toxin [Mucilaginibacter mali]